MYLLFLVNTMRRSRVYSQTSTMSALLNCLGIGMAASNGDMPGATNFPIVSSVASGGLAASWGVVPGSPIVKVSGDPFCSDFSGG